MRRRVETGPGQESVWDYPRPPRVEGCDRTVRVVFGGVEIASSRRSKRMLETSHPPVFYIPLDDVRTEYLTWSSRTTACEFKGVARYYDVRVGGRTAPAAAWTYPSPVEAFESIRHHVAFYPSAMDACFVGDERVRAQDGDFYGGWITREIVGPFKGGPGTWGW